MEFFRQVAADSDEGQLRARLTVGRLDRWCASVDRVLDDRGEQGEIYCLWGRFDVNREAINGGVRFTLPGCPNGLQWTVTVGPLAGTVTLHLAINRTEHDPDFLESIDLFLDDLAVGVAGELNGKPVPAPRSSQWLPQLGVGALVIREGEVLLVERGTPPYTGEWAVPGGKVRPGETLAEAAAREVREETGVEITAGEPVFWFEHIERDEAGALRFHYVVADVEAQWQGGEPRPGGDARAARWVPLEGLDALPINAITRQAIGAHRRKSRPSR